MLDQGNAPKFDARIYGKIADLRKVDPFAAFGDVDSKMPSLVWVLDQLSPFGAQTDAMQREYIRLQNQYAHVIHGCFVESRYRRDGPAQMRKGRPSREETLQEPQSRARFVAPRGKAHSAAADNLS